MGRGAAAWAVPCCAVGGGADFGTSLSFGEGFWSGIETPGVHFTLRLRSRGLATCTTFPWSSNSKYTVDLQDTFTLLPGLTSRIGVFLLLLSRPVGTGWSCCFCCPHTI